MEHLTEPMLKALDGGYTVTFSKDDDKIEITMNRGVYCRVCKLKRSEAELLPQMVDEMLTAFEREFPRR